MTRLGFMTAGLVAAAALMGGSALAQDAYRIGLNAELTGHASSYGQHMRIAAEIARDRINEAGGINGHPIEFVVEDNKSSPEQAVIATRNLSRADVAAILGPVQSSQARTAFPATNREEVVSVSPGSGAPGLTASNRPWTFRNAAIDQVIIDELVERMRERHPDTRTVALTVDPKDAYEKFLVTLVAPPALERNGYEMLNQDSLIEVPTETKDFSVFVTKLREMDPDVVLIGLQFEQAQGFLREANRQGLNVPMFGGLGYITESVAEAAGPVTVYAGQPFDPDAEDPQVESFVAEFRERVAEQLPGQYLTPTYIDAGAYETVNIFADAIAASEIGPDGDLDALRTAIRDYIAGLEDYQGLGNELSINEEGDAVKPTLIYETVDGRWVTL